jgi:hypothetical protein
VKQCRYRHCRRFVRRGMQYCSGLRMCQIAQEDHDAMVEAALKSMSETAHLLGMWP